VVQSTGLIVADVFGSTDFTVTAMWAVFTTDVGITYVPLFDGITLADVVGSNVRLIK
jgi:hypothetical protein